MVGPGRRGLALVAVCALLSCSGDEGKAEEPPSHAGDQRKVLVDVAEEVIRPTYAAFVESAETLATITASWAVSRADVDRVAGQEAWSAAMDIWQEAELMLLGPAGAKGATPGGEDRRDEIYSWPVTNPCRVDQETLEQAFTDLEAFASEAPNVRGLDAIEYLLFHTEPDNDCASNAAINKDGSWAALGEPEILKRRAAYASALSQLLVAEATALRDAWDPNHGNFAGELSGAGVSSEVYSSLQGALNALSDALFYLDASTKDVKLGEPAGIQECLEASCPEDRESLFANRSKEHIAANLRGFRALFTAGGGEDAFGFDDLLGAMDAGTIAGELLAELDAAEAAVGAIPGSLHDALASETDADPEAVSAAYEALKKVTDRLKTDFVGALDLELPGAVAGDND